VGAEEIVENQKAKSSPTCGHMGGAILHSLRRRQNGNLVAGEVETCEGPRADEEMLDDDAQVSIGAIRYLIFED
jgi:hypothetical protein